MLWYLRLHFWGVRRMLSPMKIRLRAWSEGKLLFDEIVDTLAASDEETLVSARLTRLIPHPRHMVELVKTQEARASAADLAARLTALLDSMQTGMAQDDRTFLLARRL